MVLLTFPLNKTILLALPCERDSLAFNECSAEDSGSDLIGVE